MAPIVELDASGKYLRSFGAGMFVQPHGLAVDRDGNVWVTDAQGNVYWSETSGGMKARKFVRK